MRLTELEIAWFGPLQHAHWQLDRRATVFLGDNEAGKSTIQRAIGTLLYGFEPAARDRHPLASRALEAEPPTLCARYELSDQTPLFVERRLGSRGTLRLAHEEGEFTGARKGNRALREVEGTPRALFRSMYSLSADDLVELSRDVRKSVDELLSGDRALERLRPVHTVLDELRNERQKLWRPDGRGKPLSRTLRAELTEAHKAFHAARGEESQLREALEETQELESELATLGEKRETLERERHDALYLREYAELTRRRARLGASPTEDLEAATLRDPAPLKERIAELEERIAHHEVRLAQRLTLTATHTRILDRAAAIEATRAHRGRYEARQESLEDARARARAIETEAQTIWKRLAGKKGSRTQLERVGNFALEGLRAEQGRWSERREARSRSASTLAWGLLSGVIGTAIVVATSLDLLAPSFVALGLTFLFLAYLELRMRSMNVREELLPDSVRTALDTLELDVGLASTPFALARLVDQLETLSSRVGELRQADDRTLDIARQIEEQEDEWEALLGELELGSEALGLEALAELENALERARSREAAALSDRRERERAQAHVDAHRPELERLRAEVAAQKAILREHVPEERDVARACKVLRERLRERDYVEDRLRELRDDPRHERLAGDDTVPIDEELWDDAALETRAREVGELDERLAVVHRRLGELNERRRRNPLGRVARAKEDVVELERRLADAEREHDRLALAEALLGYADDRWREAHQPDVLRRASEYLEQITAGRYRRLEYPRGSQSGLFVMESATGDLLPAAAPLSRGTLDQVYLCLRLGMLDHLDEGRTHLPFVLDDALVHWDAGRRAALYPILARATGKRQLILLTCHPHLAEEAAHALEAPTCSVADAERAAH